MPLLRQRELVEDNWVKLGETPPADNVAVIVPFAKFKESPDSWRARNGKLGIQLAPADQGGGSGAGAAPIVAGRSPSSPARARDGVTHRRSCFALATSSQEKCVRSDT
ncbi:MAG: hypothetical protein WDO56_03570 [Gammaproteobacteria bacterium]